jgi:hypothetical protein
MHLAPRTSRLRRLGSLTILAGLCLVAMFTITRCKYGPDKVSGVDLQSSRSSTSRCMHDCEEQFEDSLKAENKLHKKNLRKCKGGHGDGDGDDDDDDLKAGGGPGLSGVTDGDRNRRKDSACIAEELARHKAAVARIEEGERQCIASCHHQGGGSGR